jgi:hypothetical protein
LKGFLAFCVVVVAIGLVGLALPYLKERDKAYEDRLVGALEFAEGKIGETLDLRPSLFGPSISPGTEPGQWVVSGIVVSQNGASESDSAPFSAVLESVCPEVGQPSCWRMLALTVGGQSIAAGRLAEVGRDNVGAGEGFGDGAAAASSGVAVADLTAGAAAALDEPFEAAPSLTTHAVEAVAAPPSPARPVPSPVSADADLAAGGVAPTPVESELSKSELTRFVQDALLRLNYKPGPSDGKLGPQTAKAIRAYQSDFNLVPDGVPSVALLRHLRAHLDDLGQQSGEPAQAPGQPKG